MLIQNVESWHYTYHWNHLCIVIKPKGAGEGISIIYLVTNSSFRFGWVLASYIYFSLSLSTCSRTFCLQIFSVNAGSSQSSTLIVSLPPWHCMQSYWDIIKILNYVRLNLIYIIINFLRYCKLRLQYVKISAKNTIFLL